MHSTPIVETLAAQSGEGYWLKAGPGYTKYRGTTWSLIFLDQLGADGTDPRIQRACDYVLDHTQTAAGGFGATGGIPTRSPAPSSAIHCLNGNLLRALIGFGRFDDERVRGALDWQANSITGDGDFHYYTAGTSGPDFACAANGRLPCAWGATKALLGLARVPLAARTPPIARAIERGVEFLLSREPAVADYPAWEDRISSSWFKLGFPSGYVADVLQNLEALAELGHVKDPRLATPWNGSYRNRMPTAAGRTSTLTTARPGSTSSARERPSKWVTLRAYRVLKAASV